MYTAAEELNHSKTDKDATFMHMKEDHMRNGQLKPGYNVQFAVNSEYVTGIGVFSNRTDYVTLPPVLDKIAAAHGCRYKRVVADSGSESLPNYRYLHEHGELAFIKPNDYESRKTRRYKQQIGRAENMAYYETKNYFLCHEGRMLVQISDAKETAKDGSMRTISHYRCEDCGDCPSRQLAVKLKIHKRRNNW